MWQAIHRALGLNRRRAFDAAGGGRRWEGAKAVESLNAAILAGATVAARCAGYYARSNPWVAAAVQGLVANAVGTGVKPRSMHSDASVRNALHTLWLKDMGIDNVAHVAGGFPALQTAGGPSLEDDRWLTT